VPQFRISEAAELLGASDDTIRRWIDHERLPASRDAAGRLVVDGADLARHAAELARPAAVEGSVRTSARNRFAGLVTSIRRDGVMAQVDIQAGHHRVVSLMSAEALDDLGLEVGSRATAVVKATAVAVETSV
jgi:molybdopterin-binding protein